MIDGDVDIAEVNVLASVLNLLSTSMSCVQGLAWDAEDVSASMVQVLKLYQLGIWTPLVLRAV